MNNLMSKLRGLLFIIISISFIINSFIDIVPDMFIIVTAFISFVISIYDMSRWPTIMILFLFTLSQFIFFLTEGNFEYWRNAFVDSLIYICLFVSAPLLSIPVRAGGYIDYIEQLVNRYIEKQTLSYTMIAGLSAILGVFMTVGALYIVSDLFEKKLHENKRLTAEMILQGSSIPLILSPYISGVAIVLNILGLSLFPFFYWGIVMALIGFGIIVFRLIIKRKKIEINMRMEPDAIKKYQSTGSDNKPIKHGLGLQLIFGFLSMFIGVVILENILELSFIIIVSLLTLIISVLWMLTLKETIQLKEEIVHYKDNLLPNIHNHMFLIIMAVYLSKMMQLTNTPAYLSELLSMLTDISLIFTVLFIILSILIPSMFGVHSLIPVIIMATSVSPDALGINPILFAITITVGYSLSSQLSPLSVLSLVTGNLLSVRPYQLMYWNWKFVMLFLISATLFISVMNTVFY